MAEALYLDWNATAPLLPEAREAFMHALDLYGNASSVHAAGRKSRAVLEDARQRVAKACGVAPKQVFFTSGGTEANATVLTPHWQDEADARPLTHLFVSAIEHPCVLAGGQFAPEAVSHLPVTAEGVVDLVQAEAIFRVYSDKNPNGRALVSVMAANNETGIVQPIQAMAALCSQFGFLLHCDAAQVFGRQSLQGFAADVITFSALKFGAPKGVGGFVVSNPRLHLVRPLLRGGGQERGGRAGTENVAAIAGLAGAMRSPYFEQWQDIEPLRDALEAALLQATPEAIIVGRHQPRIANTSCVLVPGLSAETMLMALDLAGVCASSGSACSSGKVKTSHVLSAMGYEADLARAALRFSLGPLTTQSDIDAFVQVWTKTMPALISKKTNKTNAA